MMLPLWQSATGSDIALPAGEPAVVDAPAVVPAVAPADVDPGVLGLVVAPLPPQAATSMPVATAAPNRRVN